MSVAQAAKYIQKDIGVTVVGEYGSSIICIVLQKNNIIKEEIVMLVKKIKDVTATPVEMEGAENVKVRVLFGPEDGAPTFAMRVFEFDK